VARTKSGGGRGRPNCCCDPVSFAASAVAIVIALCAGVGCERSAEASRAIVAERRASWTREIAGIREQHAALAARLGGHGTGSSGGPAALRAHAVLDGARQSITDVENQLAQAEGRMQQAIHHGGEAGQRSIDEESAKARGYLQALAEQLGAAAGQLDELSQNENEAKKQSP